ncbi:MAG: hypothetical protein C0594_04300 [Marinilabiliales bacterium]|nr:MAG: hypothetical protein C0594_04300 [Marinilabiliales bacterium]
MMLFVVFMNPVVAQKRNRIDVGPFLGVNYYMGELNLSKQFLSPGPVAGLAFRFPLNKRYAIRGNLVNATISADDYNSDYSFQRARNHQLKTNLTELSFLAEFNYLNYIEGSDREYFSPFVSAGLAGYYSTGNNSPLGIAIPFGLGIKYNLTEKLNFSLEWIFRKTFSDNLDMLAGKSLSDLEIKQTAFGNNKDWYCFAAAVITYKFKLRKNVCYGL